MTFAETFGSVAQALQIAPVRAHPDQQAGEQRRTDQHIDAPVQQTDVQRVRRHHQLDRLRLIQWRRGQRAPAPVTGAHGHFTALQTLAFMGGETLIADRNHGDLQRTELLIQLSGERRPLSARHSLELLDQQVLHAPGVVQVIAGKALVKDLDHQVWHQVDRRTEGDDGDQVQADQDAQHGVSIPTRNG
ncbi:hypothetical protein D3C81_1697100 [compost metagenome]